MIHLSSFHLTEREVANPNIYPYHVFAKKEDRHIRFDHITIFYGGNASGKSTLLNIMANTLGLEGKEYATCNKYGRERYFERFIRECSYVLGEDEEGNSYQSIPVGSRYVKSEDILYEIKKIQQETVLQEGYIYEQVRKGMSKQQKEELTGSKKMWNEIEILKFAQEKYSNGETTLQMLLDYLRPDALYLLDEPEVSLSPTNQVLLAQEINTLARFLNCQFIISTHSPFLLGTLNARIYNLDGRDFDTVTWTELENVLFYYKFFKDREKEFKGEI
ncbi:MAG: hypothetical protein K0S04_2329 [Herbinix sp.]|jgi:predicted ATPase|nr:hypothetical protein [Herbinix sp.]